VVPTVRLPSRQVLEERRTGFIVRGTASKADVWTTLTDDGAPLVIKDFRRKSWPVRIWGRLQIGREARFLELLADLEEVPRFYGLLDSCALAMEKLDGEPLYWRELHGVACRPHLDALRRVLDGVHSRGIVHNDLRGRENVWLRADGRRIVVIDWAGALRLAPGGIMNRLFFGALEAIDDSAFLKWKEILDPSSLTDDDRAAQQRFRRWRRLWPFNRKGVGWTRDTT
jgi:predicted Ser/Thr protein kinase